MSDKGSWSPVDYIVGFLAVVVCFITFGAIMGVLLRGQPMTTEQSDIMESITTAIISIVSMYVGASIQKHKDR